jgi:hypothetical protein
MSEWVNLKLKSRCVPSSLMSERAMREVGGGRSRTRVRTTLRHWRNASHHGIGSVCVDSACCLTIHQQKDLARKNRRRRTRDAGGRVSTGETSRSISSKKCIKFAESICLGFSIYRCNEEKSACHDTVWLCWYWQPPKVVIREHPLRPQLLGQRHAFNLVFALLCAPVDTTSNKTATKIVYE